MRLTNSQGAIHQSSPCTLGFSREQYAFTIVREIPDLECCHQPNLGLTLDIFLFPVTTLNNFLCPTTPTTFSRIHHPGGLGRQSLQNFPHPSPSCPHPMEVSWSSNNCPDYSSIKFPCASEPTSNRSPHRK